jgi:hypothetical protein
MGCFQWASDSKEQEYQIKRMCYLYNVLCTLYKMYNDPLIAGLPYSTSISTYETMVS